MHPSARSTLGRCVISARNASDRLLLLIVKSVVWWRVWNKWSSTKMATCTKGPSFATRTGSCRIVLPVSNSLIVKCLMLISACLIRILSTVEKLCCCRRIENWEMQIFWMARGISGRRSSELVTHSLTHSFLLFYDLRSLWTKLTEYETSSGCSWFSWHADNSVRLSRNTCICRICILEVESVCR